MLDVSEQPRYNIQWIANMAGAKYGITKKTLQTAQCIETERTGGPKAFRSKESELTVRKIFDAVTEPSIEYTPPMKCRRCRYANTGQITTRYRNKDMVSGCEILKQRQLEMSDSN